MSIADAQYVIMGSPNELIRCQYGILNGLLKKMASAYPLGAPKGETFPVLTKRHAANAILSYHPFESKSTCK